MKLFDKIKSLFKKEITAPEIAKERPISVSNPSGVIKIGSKLSVGEDFVAVLCTKGKVCDIFIKGEYELTPGLMQKANRIRKLSIPNKKGKYKKDFKGFIYFVNLKQFDDEFSSYNGVTVKEKKLFTSVVELFGKFSYKIQNPKRFMEMLIMEFYNVSGELPNEKVRLLAGQYTDKFVESKKLKFSYFYNNNPVINEGLVDYMKKQFSTVGIELIDIKIESYKFSKKLLKQIESGKLFIKDVANTYQEVKDKENALKEIVENKQDELKLDVNNMTDYDNDVFNNDNESQLQVNNALTDNTKSDEFGINDTNELNVNETDNKPITNRVDLYNQTYESLDHLEYDKTENQSLERENNSQQDTTYEEQDRLVENDEDGVVTADIIKIKKCKNCGASNSGDSEQCFNCGASFVRKCEKCGHCLKDDEFVCPNCGSIVI